jgi:hypothetical protein
VGTEATANGLKDESYLESKMASITAGIEIVATSRFFVLNNILNDPAPLPYTDLTSFIEPGKLVELGEYLAEQHLFDFDTDAHPNNDKSGGDQSYSIKNFNAAGRKHADAIELQDQTGYGDEINWPFSDFRDCRVRRGSAEYWRSNANAERLPGLVRFVDQLPFFQSTGKVTIILSKAGSEGMEHVDHKYNDWVSEFVWVRTGVGPTKEFFVRDGVGDKRYATTPACCLWFDDHHAHCIDPTKESAYSIRIDGVFTDDWRAYLCDVGVFGSQSPSLERTEGGLCGVLGAQRGEVLSSSALEMYSASLASAAAECALLAKQ